MSEELLIGLSSILVLGIAAQWLAWRLRLPSILLLLIFGFIAGPVTGFLDPDHLFGDLLFPIVSLSVAIILFEGGLSLNIRELREVGVVVRRLISVGVLVTWAIGSAAAYLLLDMDIALSMLLGAILVVSGPTVIMPLLRHVRPTPRIGSTLKWEGILIDPVGATLAVLVFEAIVAGDFAAESPIQQVPLALLVGFLEEIFVGGVTGIIGALLLSVALRRYWIPEFLQNAVTLMIVITGFTIANLLQAESGLITVTLMGIVLTNQRQINVKGIIQFKESLVMLLLSSVFILLAARVSFADLRQLGPNSIAFVALLILVVRPLAVWVSTLGSELNWRERAFLAWLAPRGIVAAAVSAIFALELSHTGHPNAESLVPITFLVIVSTVSIYGLTASLAARLLGVSQADPQGILFVGAHGWAREMAAVLRESGCRVILVDSNRAHVRDARMRELNTHYGSILGEHTIEELPLDGIGRLIALTPNDEVNALAVLRFGEVFDRTEGYQLAPPDNSRRRNLSTELRGRVLFGPNITYDYLEKLFRSGAAIKATPLTEQFNFNAFKSLYGEGAVPLFTVSASNKVSIFTADRRPSPVPGDTLISLLRPEAVAAHEERAFAEAPR